MNGFDVRATTLSYNSARCNLRATTTPNIFSPSSALATALSYNSARCNLQATATPKLFSPSSAFGNSLKLQQRTLQFASNDCA
jgi:hypothetical protein